ncbi:LysR family transcriptional regulator [Christensenellaceae bacterium OttesenSCG-928-M15]|nr:LysR family transcriptional regulator [Christensenellaceae bacterium OttesenSCG-928-M15]
MDTKKYEVLLRAADEGSFLHAGEKLGYTQSGITQMMNSLEREIGFPLLARTNKGVSLTSEGQAVAPLIRELLRIQSLIEQECAQIKGLETGSVRIGGFTSISANFLPAIIERFQTEHPNVRVELLENGSAEILEGWLSEGRVDIAFYSLPEKSTFDQIPLIEDTLYAVLPNGHPMENAEAFPVERFAEEPFLMYQSTSGYDRDLWAVLKRAGITPNISYATNFDYSIITMAAHNLGISIMPYEILKDHLEMVVIKPLLPSASRQLGIAVRSMQEISPAMKKFIRCAKEVMTPNAG